MNTATNTCSDKDPSVDVCNLRSKFFNSASDACEEWVTCDAAIFVELDIVTNTCKEMAPSIASCQFKSKFFDEAANACVEWKSCTGGPNIELDT